MESPTDAVAEIVASWGRERPDLDASPLLVFGRMARLTQLVEPHLRPPFAAAGLGNGDFDLLAALRRAGHPYRLSAGELSTSLLVTTGAISKRLDRLEAHELVRREVSESDGRGRLVTLQPKGLTIADELIGVHLANEARLLTGLDPAQRHDLATLLGRLAESLEALTP
jgi:DNA-binding MarR family transcriptional regulator